MESKRKCTDVRFSTLCFLLAFVLAGALPSTANAAVVSTVFVEDFESGWNGWHADNGVWEVGSPSYCVSSAHSGTNCAATVLNGNYPSDTDSRLISPTIQLPKVTGKREIRLYYWQAGSYANNDYRNLQYQYYTGMGSTGWSDWFTLSANYANGTCVWSTDSADLSYMSGRRVRLGFYHSAVWPNESAGWYIDDVSVVVVEPEFRSPETFEDGWQEWYAGNGEWEVGAPTSGPGEANSGNSCAGTILAGLYEADTDTTLVSPTLLLPTVSGEEEVQLRFWQAGNHSGNDSRKVRLSVAESNNTWVIRYNADDRFNSNESWLRPWRGDFWEETGRWVGFYSYEVPWTSLGAWQSGSIAGFSWSTGSNGEITITSDRDYQFWIYIWAYVREAKTVTLQGGGDCVPRCFLNFSFDSPIQFPATLNLIAGWNRIDITGYNQNQGYTFQITTPLGREVDVINSTQTNSWSYTPADLTPAFANGAHIWSRSMVDLSGYSGKLVRAMFSHSAVWPNESSGWYLDDVEIWRGVPHMRNPEDFELGWADWSSDNGEWEVGAPTAGAPSAHSGQECAGTALGGNYEADTDSRLISPTLRLPDVIPGQEIWFRWWQWFCYSSNDQGVVQLSELVNGTWSDWINAPIPTITGNSGGWSQASVELTPYAGKAVRMAFYHTAVWPNECSGWYIDDVWLEPAPDGCAGVKGDINNDGNINSGDAILALRIAAGLPIGNPPHPADDCERCRGDVNCDDLNNSGDAILVLREAAGLNPTICAMDC
ncbi:choice-of-anchor J domain-containing protein [Candidatus Poribacteria bacterium]|nr:choice-of-anchor J domain-containing protein [Candidatus Poribacteria bacterium]